MSGQFLDTFKYKLIYVFAINDEEHKGLLKIGDTTCSTILNARDLEDNCEILNQSAKERIESYTKTAGIIYKLLYTTLAITNNNNYFRDYEVHSVLMRSGILKKEIGGAREWFICDLKTAINAIIAVKQLKFSLDPYQITIDRNPIIFRPEQQQAIKATTTQFTKNGKLKNLKCQMLWNAKMRFGKTLTALQVVKELNFKKTIIITHRPVVSNNWFEDFNKIFYDTTYRFGSKTKGESLQSLNDSEANFVYFASIQDLRGSEVLGGKYDKNEELFLSKWDFVIVDEAHEGTQTNLGDEVIKWLSESKNDTKTLYLSGTPFNLLSEYSKQRFKENEIFTWDYIMEQKAKYSWYKIHSGDSNPYESLPRLNIFTYSLGEIFCNTKFVDVEDSAFNFKEFFRVWTGDIEKDRVEIGKKVQVGKFVYENEVNSFLNLLVQTGEHNYPFSTKEYRDNFRHTLWILPGVKEAKALSALLKEHKIFGNGGFEIINVAGKGDEEVKSEDALKMVLKAISDKPEITRTITLSCGKLTTGVTIPAWTACFMLSGSSSTSASTYLQTIFRVQNPANIGGKMKTDSFVFDFAPDRTLKMVAEAGNLSIKGNDSKIQMGEFLNFCPVIGISGSQMKPYSAESMLVQLKRVIIDKLVSNGFDDRNLYNDRLFTLDSIQLAKFEALKQILKIKGSEKLINDDIVINKEGFNHEKYDIKKNTEPNYQTIEDKEKKKKRDEILKQRAFAISILRTIAIRIPLLVYGAEVPFTENIDLNNFTNLIDDKSWKEFMPLNISKTMFNDLTQYFDNEVFIEASKKIRLQTKATDDLPINERVVAIAKIFATFKNPDKETILTPWRVVNMHICKAFGGYNFFDSEFKKKIDIDKNVNFVENDITKNIYSKDNKILEINSKTGLYPLFFAFSFYQNKKATSHEYDSKNLWKEILKNNIFVICRTKMARTITHRTLCGFDKDLTTNILVYEDIVKDMKDKEEFKKVIDKITSVKNWIEYKKEHKGEQKMIFNGVVGNPPYQENIDNRSEQPPVYHLFYEVAFALADKVTLITPARFLFDVGKTPREWNHKMLNDNHYKVIECYLKSSEVFPSVDIKGGVAIGFRDKEQNFKMIETYIHNDIIKDILNKVNPNTLNSLAAIMYSNTSYKYTQAFYTENPSYKDRVSGGSIRYLSSSAFDKFPETFLKDNPNNGDYIQILGRQNSKRVFYWFKRTYIDPPDNFEFWKVFLPSSNGSGAIGEVLSTPLIGTPLIGTPLIGTTETFLSFGKFNKKIEAENLLKYLKTKFARTMLGTRKVTQGNKNKKIWSNVPLQNFTAESDIDWSKPVNEIDKQLYKKYNLTSEQITYIEEKIAVME